MTGVRPSMPETSFMRARSPLARARVTRRALRKQCAAIAIMSIVHYCHDGPNAIEGDGGGAEAKELLGVRQLPGAGRSVDSQ